MSKFVPFTASIELFTSPVGKKRLEYVRELQKISAVAYYNMSQIDGFSLANPGGGQMDYFNGAGSKSGYAKGFAIKPAIGGKPAQIVISGYLDAETDKNYSPSVEKEVIHAGEYSTGEAGKHLYNSNPKTANDNYCTTIMNALDEAMNGAIDSYAIYKVEVSGVIYGKNGVHFPS